MRAALDEVAPGDHLTADESAGDVRVNGLRCIERRLPLPERPGASLLITSGEEAQELEGLEESADHLGERRGAVTVGGRLFLGELDELSLQLRVDPARPVLNRDQRLRRQRLELWRELTRPFVQPLPCVEVSQDRFQG